MDINQIKLTFYGSFHQPINAMGRAIESLLNLSLYPYNSSKSFQNLLLLTSQMQACSDETLLLKDTFPLLLQNFDELLVSITAQDATAPF
jgi:hypothetical protein